MHKKHNKLNHKDHRHKKSHVKKDTDDSTLEIIKAPQNSRNELGRKLGLGDCETEEKFKSEKHKHKRKEGKSSDRRSKSKHEKKSVHSIADIQDLVLNKEAVTRKAKKEKYDKERLNKIEKYLEGLNKVSSNKKLSRNRSLSLESSKSVLKHREKHIRREKTFHDTTSRDVSPNFRLKTELPPITKEKSHKHKKHKHKENKKRDSSKEKNTKDNQKAVMYCEVELQSPFVQKKKYNVERLFPEAPRDKSSRKRSSSRDNSTVSQLETTLISHRDKSKYLKDKKMIPIKFSPRKSKLKTDLRGHKDQRSNGSLGSYGKHFAFDKKPQNEKETARQKKKKRKEDSATKIQKRKRDESESKQENKPEKTKKNQEKTSNSDQYKAKIEDDIKSYFCRIQSLIDKKLEYILGNSSNSKESKNNSIENENDMDKTKSKKEKKTELKEKQRERDRSHSKRRKNTSTEEEKQEKRLEDPKAKHPVEEERTVRKSRRIKHIEASSTSLKRERYPSDDFRNYRRHQSPHQQQQQHQEHLSVFASIEKQISDKEFKQHKRYKSPYGECRMNPDRLIKMLEHPSTFSVQSTTNLFQEKHFDDVKHRPNVAQTGCNEIEYYQKRDRSRNKRNPIPDEDNIKDEVLEKSHQQESSKKIKKHVTESLVSPSNTSLIKEKLIDISKGRLDDIYSEPQGNAQRRKRDRSLTRKKAIPGEDDFVEMEPAYLQELNNKKFKKRMRQLMNLECKTVSIVGIPSQIRESTIFNETQTTTSLNIMNPIECSIEQKKKSKRFKLYYKYSVADNKCSNESDKSSEGKKSIVSDSYRVVSDPSDHNIEIWEDEDETTKDVNKEADADPTKIHFIMKKDKVQKNCGDVSHYRAIEHVSKKYRKRGDSPKPVILNNIVEEPSNISIVIHANETSKKDINCTFFKTLKSSNSDCNLELIKKSTQNESNKHKNRHIEKPLKENVARPKSPSKRSRDRDRQREVKPDKKPKYEEKHARNKKIMRIESQHKIKKKHRNVYNYTSKSDIDISYDSLRKHKFRKGKPQVDTPSQFREQLRQLLPKLLFQKSSPNRKSIDLIIKEEIREIIRDIPRTTIIEILPTDDLKQTETHNPTTEPTQEESKELHKTESKEAKENPRSQDVEEEMHCSEKLNDSIEEHLKESNKSEDVEEKTYCSKKIGTHHAMTRIPSLIKGYTTPQVPKDEIIETHTSTHQVNDDELTENVMAGLEELGEKKLVNAATEVSLTEEKLEILDKPVIILENKKSQTPSYLDAPTVVAICDPAKQYKCPKKIGTVNNMKRCQIIDPFIDTKLGYGSKPTRPIINLENNQFPNRKLQESDKSDTPVSGQSKRQNSTFLEGKTVKFENQDNFQAAKSSRKPLERRPATADGKLKETTNGILDKFRKRPTKPALTMSTNTVTINTICAETFDTQIKSNKKDNKHARTACANKSKTQNLASKSSLSVNDMNMESEVGSLVCVDRYNTTQKLNFSSNSNSRSLDRYTTKCLINDNPHASKLFLTKSFDPKMNTYQRRKMYDENIRKKMKKRNGNPNQMGPRIYEVRYLTLENRNVDESSGATPVVNQKCISRLPTYNTKNNRIKPRTRTFKASTKKSKRNFPIKNKEDACKFSGRDIFAPIVSDVDQLNKFRRKTFPEKKVEEIFVKGSLFNQESTENKEQSTSGASKVEIDNAENSCKANKIDSEGANQNFKELIDCLYNSIITYCDTKFKLPQETSSNPKSEQSVPKSPPINEKSYVVFPKPSNSIANDAFKKNSCSEGNVSSEERQSKCPTSLICSHLSCPVLAGSTSSFDYLYEDGPIELNKDAVLLHFKKPMKTILGYALNNTARIKKETLLNLPKKVQQTSNSVTESEESGYSSNNSKKCGSVCSFFKKPSIVNLFKPVKKLDADLPSTSSLNDSRSGPNLQEYNVMNQKCIEYAEKVRNQIQNKDECEETFREIPLDVLLCKKSSIFLNDFNSNCSLCKKRSYSDLPDITEADELSNTEDLDHLSEVKNSIKDYNLTEDEKNIKTLLGSDQEETLVLYKDHTPSLEVIAFRNSQISFSNDDTSLLMKEMQCPVVLSITNLNSCSLTIVEESDTNKNGFYFGDKLKENVKPIELNSNVEEDISHSDTKSMDIDAKSEVSSTFGFGYSNSSTMTSKFMAKRFFDNLLKVYEKEMYVTNKLFQDDDFFVKVLLESVKAGEATKVKNFKLKKLIKNCIGNVFNRNNTGKPCRREDTQATSNSSNNQQRKLQTLAKDARQYFSMFVQAVKTNKDINDEVKICGLLKLLERIEDGDFAILRKKEEVDFEEEIREQVKEAFVNIYQMSVKEARKRKRSLTTEDLKLIRTFVSKYRIGLLSKTDLIATYIGRGTLKTEGHLKAAVTYLIQQNKTKDVNLKDFDEHCEILAKCS